MPFVSGAGHWAHNSIAAAAPRAGRLRYCWLVLVIAVCSCSRGPSRAGVLIHLDATDTPVAAVSTATSAGATPVASAAQPAIEIGVSLGDGVPDDLLQRPAAQGLRPVERGQATVALARAGAGEGIPARYWVPVTDLFNDATAIASTDLLRLLRGEFADWKALGASAASVQVLLPAEHIDEIQALLGAAVPLPAAAAPGTPTPAPIATAAAIATNVASPPHVVPQSEIVSAVSFQRGSFSLLPLEDVDFRVRALPVDGIDLVRGLGDAASYPLVTRVAISAVSGKHTGDAVAVATTALSAPLPAPERILATGDIIPARCVYDRQRRYGDYRHAFLEVAATLKTGDLAIGSLDASISDKGVPIGCRETFSLMAPAESVAGLTYAGIGLLTTAANHAKDCGESACGDLAFLDTMARLDAAGIAHTGGGRTLAEARTATVLTVKGIRFGFLGYDDIASQYYGAGERSPGTAPLDLTTLAADVRAAKAHADVVVEMVHWGVEYTPDPTDRQRQAARIAVDAGAALVVGNHPHVVQAVELFPTGFADYALGNFVFDQDWSQETLEGVVMEAVFDGPRLRQVGFLPLKIQDMHQPHFLTPAQGRPILDRMQKASVRVAAPP